MHLGIAPSRSIEEVVRFQVDTAPLAWAAAKLRHGPCGSTISGRKCNGGKSEVRMSHLQLIVMWSGRAYIAFVLGGAIASLFLWWFGGQLTRIQETHIAELQSHTAQLMQDNLRLEAQIAPRRLTQSQQRSLEALFARFPGRTVHVSSYMQDTDAAMLGRQILQAVTSAKLQKSDMLMALEQF